MRKLIFRSAAISLAFLGVAACTSGHEPPPMDLIGQTFDPIVNGTMDTSNTTNDAVVLIYNNALQAECTGTVIAKNLVLTARHCVSGTASYVSCNNGDVTSNPGANSIYIFKGVSPDLNSASPIAQGKAIFNDGSSNLCGHDVSIIQTSWDIMNITPMKVRVSHAPSANEKFKAVGYGLTNPNNQSSSGTRYYRNNVTVLGLAQGTSCQGVYDGCDFMGTESICSGDSGGPAISSQGAVMGVTSRGADCYADENIWTRTDVYKWLFDKAAAAAGTSYTGEDGTVYGAGGSGGTGGTGGSGGSTGGSGGSTGGSGGSTGGAGGAMGGSGGGTAGAGGAAGSPGAEAGLACGPNNSCAAGMACVSDFDTTYCAPACGQNNSCPAGWECATQYGYCFKAKSCTGPQDCAIGTVCAADPSGNYCTPICDPNNPVCPSDSTCSSQWSACFRNAGSQAADQSSTSSGCALAAGGSGRGASNAWWLPALGLGAALLMRRRRG